MSDFVTSLVRTYVPIAVGALISWLATRGITLDPQTQTSLIIGLTGVIQGLYYFVARLIERKLPNVGGLLLGSSKKPEYTEVK